VPEGERAKEVLTTDLVFSGKQPRPDRQFCGPRYTAVPPPVGEGAHPLDINPPTMYSYLSEGVRMSVPSDKVEVDNEGAGAGK
jgi:hypothetical protein